MTTMFGLTLEEADLVCMVHDNYEMEFKEWAIRNEEILMKWYDNIQHMGLFERTSRFAHYCSVEFLKFKEQNEGL